MTWNKKTENDLKTPHIDCKMNYNEWRRMLSMESFRRSIQMHDSILLECFKLEEKEKFITVWNYKIRAASKDEFIKTNPLAIPLYFELSYTNYKNMINSININFHQDHSHFKNKCRYYLKFGDINENWGGGLFKN